MIDVAQLTEDDIGARVLWEVAPGIENPAQIAAWTEDKMLLAVPMTDRRRLQIIWDIDPARVRRADRLSKAS